MALSFEAVTRGPSRPCPALGLKRALFSEPSREDGAAGAKVPDPASWKHAPRTFMTNAGRSCSGPGCFCFREESAEVAKGRGPVACLFPRSFLLRSQESVCREELLARCPPGVLPASPSAPTPSFGCCYLLLQNVELFKRHRISFVAIQLP